MDPEEDPPSASRQEPRRPRGKEKSPNGFDPENVPTSLKAGAEAAGGGRGEEPQRVRPRRRSPTGLKASRSGRGEGAKNPNAFGPEEDPPYRPQGRSRGGPGEGARNPTGATPMQIHHRPPGRRGGWGETKARNTKKYAPTASKEEPSGRGGRGEEPQRVRPRTRSPTGLKAGAEAAGGMGRRTLTGSTPKNVTPRPQGQSRGGRGAKNPNGLGPKDPPRNQSRSRGGRGEGARSQMDSAQKKITHRRRARAEAAGWEWRAEENGFAPEEYPPSAQGKSRGPGGKGRGIRKG